MIAESLDKSGNIYHIDKSDIENRGINNIGNHTLTKINNKVLKPVSISHTLFSNTKYSLIILKVYKYNEEFYAHTKFISYVSWISIWIGHNLAFNSKNLRYRHQIYFWWTTLLTSLYLDYMHISCIYIP